MSLISIFTSTKTILGNHNIFTSNTLYSNKSRIAIERLAKSDKPVKLIISCKLLLVISYEQFHHWKI